MNEYDFMSSGYMQKTWATLNGARTSRYVPEPSGVSSVLKSADSTYEYNYNLMVSWGRELADNKEAVAPAVQRLVDNVIQTGFVPMPDTGDKDFDKELIEAFYDWSTDRFQTDTDGELTFMEMERQVFRSVIVDGQIFALPCLDGKLQLLETELCRTPSDAVQTQRDKTHLGVRKLDGKIVGYYFSGDRDSDPYYYPALDEQGYPAVISVMLPNRANMSRGISALSVTRDMASFLSEINFATLVKAKLGALYCLIEKDLQGASGSPADRNVAARHAAEEKVVIEPGVKIIAPTGKDIAMFTSNVPNPEQFKHFEQTVKFICANINVPSEIALLDSSEANFSALRATMGQAYKNYRSTQAIIESRFHRPVWQWFARRKYWSDARYRQIPLQRFLRCRWNKPGWEYLEPLTDQRANTEGLSNGTISWQMIANKTYGVGADVIFNQQLNTIAAVIDTADKSARRLQECGIDICWRELVDMIFLHKLDVNEEHSDSETAGIRPLTKSDPKK